MSAGKNLLETGLVLLGLCAVAIALPLFCTLGEGATFFVAHRAAAADILSFALAVYLLPPVLLFLMLRALHRLQPAVGVVVERLLVGLLAGLWLLGLLSVFGSVLALLAACVMALLVGWLYARKLPMRSFLQLVGLVSPLVLIFFLFFSPVKKLLLTEADVMSGAVAGNNTPVVMLVLDELSLAAISTVAGDIDEQRLPNFGRLAALSTWYSNTTTVSTHTQRAVPAILAGKRVDSDTQPVYSQFPQNMFTVLAASHTVFALETVSRLCPKSVCGQSAEESPLEYDPSAMYADALVVYLHTLLPPALAQRWLPPVSSSWRGFRQHDETPPSATADSGNRFAAMIADMAADNKKRFRRFLQNLLAHDGASFSYFHLVLPHSPWIYLPDGTVYNGRFAPGQSSLRYDWQGNQHLVDQGVLRYSLQVEFVDRLLGQMLDGLIAGGRMEETLLLVVSDHGVSFATNRERRIPVASTLAGVALVPLFIKYPGQFVGTRDRRPVETIDIFPTVMDVLNLPIAEAVDGQSLLADDWQMAPRRIHEGGDAIPDFEAALDLNTAIARISTIVQPGRTGLDSVGLGIGRHYLGRRLDKLKLGPEGSFSLDLDRPEWYASVDMNSGFLPARLTGTLTGAQAGTDILIALNGVIAGSGESYGSEGRVSVMLDPRRFREGDNRITALSLEKGTIAPLPLVATGAGWQVELDAAGELHTVRRAGQQWRRSQGLVGFASQSPPSSPVASFDGWAYDAQKGRSAEEILLLDNEKVVSNSFLPFKRPMVANARGFDEELQIGFSIELDPGLREKRHRLSVVVLFDSGRFLHLKPGAK